MLKLNAFPRDVSFSLVVGELHVLLFLPGLPILLLLSCTLTSCPILRAPLDPASSHQEQVYRDRQGWRSVLRIRFVQGELLPQLSRAHWQS